jgi:biopolymer transport protein ExbB/TolQ
LNVASNYTSRSVPVPRNSLLEDKRAIIACVGVVVGVLWVAFAHFVVPDTIARMFFDHNREHPTPLYPFSVQTWMWIAFFIGVGEILVRFDTSRAERELLASKLLPEDETTVLLAPDLVQYYRRARSLPLADRCFLPRLIIRVIQQFQSSRSVDQSATLLNTSTEMFSHEVDLRYGMIRYIEWVIPTLGFIGTVIGIGLALEHAGGHSQDPNLLAEVTNRLAVSFNGTLVALLLAAILVFLQHIAQEREEHALNAATQYCLDNLINRLYVPTEERAEAAYENA